MNQPPEAWLRGPVADVPALLQPVAHALLQAGEDLRGAMTGYPRERLWERPAGVASPGFHLLHIAGVIDRLFTYARGEQLSDEQRAVLAAESETHDVAPEEILARVDLAIHAAVEQLKRTDPRTLTESRDVGRQRLPSTVLGLLFHAAEHTQRHTGQLLVTARIAVRGPIA